MSEQNEGQLRGITKDMGDTKKELRKLEKKLAALARQIPKRPKPSGIVSAIKGMWPRKKGE